MAVECDAGPVALGTWLRRRRQTAGLTLEELASRSGLSVRTISDLERGQTRKPYPRSIRAVASALGLPQAVSGELIARYRSCGSLNAAASGGDLTGLPAPQENRGPGPAAESGTVIPRQLPAAVADFAGRTAELTMLDSLLETRRVGGTGMICAIGGTAGVGKTAMAVHWAHRVATRFPDGQLYLNLRGFDPSGQPVTPAAAVRYFLDALDVPLARIPESAEAQGALYRSLLASRRILVILDNARDETQVRPLLPGSPGCLLVLTSRRQMDGLTATHGARLLNLDVLSHTDAQQLLVARLGASRVATEPEAADRLGRLCAHLPLALAIAAARAAATPSMTLAAVAGQLADARIGLDAPDCGDGLADARTVLSWSFRGLRPLSARVFGLIGAHPGPDISAPAAASLAGIPLAGARRALGELTHARLLSEHAPGRYTCHDLLRSYAVEQAHTALGQQDRHDAQHRMLDHYLHTASAAAMLLHPHLERAAVGEPRRGVRPERPGNVSQAQSWFEREHQVLLSVIARAVGSGFPGYAWRIAWAFRTYLDWRGHWRDEVTCLRIALDAVRCEGACRKIISRPAHSASVPSS